jgi:ribokinase
MPCRIAVVGSSNMDIFLRTPRLPQAGETLLGHGCHFDSGGKGANQAVMAARLGAQVTLVSRVGQDAFGQDLLRRYQAEGIDASHVHVDPECSTGLAVIAVDDLARNTIIVTPGANARLNRWDVDSALAALRSVQMVLCQCEVPLETSLAAFRMARNAGVTTILNPAPAQELPEDLLRVTDYLAPNETELELLTGQRVTTHEAAHEAARKMVRSDNGPCAVVVTLGERGALVVEREQSTHFVAPQVQAVDTTGAGDAFVGSLAVALAEGRTLRDAVPFAIAAASLSVTRQGTQASFPRRAEVEAFLDAACGLTRSQP